MVEEQKPAANLLKYYFLHKSKVSELHKVTQLSGKSVNANTSDVFFAKKKNFLKNY